VSLRGRHRCLSLLAGLDDFVDQLEVHVLEGMLDLADGEDIGSGADEAACHLGCGSPGIGYRELIGPRFFGVPALDGADPGEELVRVAERREGLDDERLLEKLLSQVLGSADGSQCRVQDGDPVAESFGLLEPVGGERGGCQRLQDYDPQHLQYAAANHFPDCRVHYKRCLEDPW